MTTTTKTVIFDNYPCNPRDGGPSGFIAQNLKGKNSDLFELASNRKKDSTSISQNFIQKIKKIFYTITTIVNNKAPLRHPRWYHWMKSSINMYLNANLNKIETIYFHDIFSLYFCLPLLKRDQLVILQPHMPELPHEEVSALENISTEEIEWVKKITPIVFRRTNVLIFPNIGAKVIYNEFISNAHRTLFCQSGGSPFPKSARIPLSTQFIYFAFIGRRNQIKGFDILKIAFEDAFLINQNIRLILIGNGPPWEHPGVIDIGHSNNPQKWIHSVDYVVNVNRQSYFDLSIIESLSVGTPIVFTPKFGHSELLLHKSNGLIPLKKSGSDKEIKDSLISVFASPPLGKTLDKSEPRKENKNIFIKQYSDTAYLDRLSQTLTKISTSSNKSN